MSNPRRATSRSLPLSLLCVVPSSSAPSPGHFLVSPPIKACRRTPTTQSRPPAGLRQTSPPLSVTTNESNAEIFMSLRHPHATQAHTSRLPRNNPPLSQAPLSCLLLVSSRRTPSWCSPTAFPYNTFLSGSYPPFFSLSSMLVSSLN